MGQQAVAPIDVNDGRDLGIDLSGGQHRVHNDPSTGTRPRVVMTITELINLLEEARAEVGDDAEIQLATQASYPLRYDPSGLCVEPDNHDKPTDDLVVWLVEGQQDRNTTCPNMPSPTPHRSMI